ncbi:MAG: hypothetical protein V1678_01250 [Candidatus Aenigmatarchaeota archaeon]
MVVLFGTVGFGARYVADIATNIVGYNHYLNGLSNDPEIKKIITKTPLSNVSAGKFSTTFYDMCAGEKTVKGDSKLIGLNSAKMFILLSTVDDILDKRVSTLDEKSRLLENVKSDMFGTTSHQSSDAMEQASYILTKSIRKDILSVYGNGDMKAVSDSLTDSIKRQFVENDYKSMIDIAKNIGACCSESVAVLSELVVGGKHTCVRHTARKIGEYSQLVDEYYDTDENLREGVNTYSTLMIRNNGDSPSLRRRIKKDLQAEANISFAESLSGLSEKDRYICKTLKNLVDFRYMVADALKKNYISSHQTNCII